MFSLHRCDVFFHKQSYWKPPWRLVYNQLWPYKTLADTQTISISDETPKDKKPVKSGLGKAGFGRAMKAMKTFKRATTVIRATRRFRKGPLDTILKISQEEAMAKIIDENHKKQEHEFNELHRCTSGRLASQLKTMLNEENLEKKKSQLEMEQAKQRQEERTCKLRQTVLHLMPNLKTT